MMYPEADSNCHTHTGATPSRWCVYQFRHLGLFSKWYRKFKRFFKFYKYFLLGYSFLFSSHRYDKFFFINIWITPSTNPTRGTMICFKCPYFIMVIKISVAGTITSARSLFNPNKVIRSFNE